MQKKMRLTAVFAATAMLSSVGLNAQANTQSETASANQIAGVPGDDTVPFVINTPGSASTPTDSALTDGVSLAGSTITVNSYPGYSIGISHSSQPYLTVDSEGVASIRTFSGSDRTYVRATDVGVQILSRTSSKSVVQKQYSVTVNNPSYILYQGPSGEIYILAPEADVPTDAWSPPLTTDVELTDYAPEPASDEPPEPVDDESAVEFPAGYEALAMFGQPWAADTATGQMLPSEFSVSGNTITQTTDASGATGVVVSDPFFVPIAYIAIGAAARHLVAAGVRAVIIRGAVIRGAQYTTRGDYSTFDKFKAVHGKKKGYDWHHIVEQGNLKTKWNPKAIHHRNNLIAIPREIHRKCVNSWMNKKGVNKFDILASKDQTMRQVVRSKDFPTQHAIGLKLLRHCGVQI